jgi:lipopolysaccharide export system protein LptA
MTPEGLRRARLGLALAGVLVVLAVVFTLRGTRVAPAPSPTPAAGPAKKGGEQASRLGGFLYRKFKEGREAFVLEADSMVGSEQQEVRLTGVRMHFPYVAQGEPGQAQLTADSGSYAPGQDRGHFEGNVRVTTADGVELRTESLSYRGDRGVARSDARVEFRRKDVSGSSSGMLYRAEERTLELLADARLRIEGEGGAPPLEISSQQASAARAEGVLRFTGGAVAVRGSDRLTADQLTVVFSTEDESLLGVQAGGSVVMETDASRPVPGAPGLGSGGGRRRLTAKRLDMYFRPNRTLKNATAGPDAELTLWPGPGQPKERRQLAARMLTFRFDGQGRVSRVNGQKDVRLGIEDLPPVRQEPRTLTCRNFTAGLEPASGEVRGADFNGDVVIVRGTQRSRSREARYEGEAQTLLLEGSPELTDSADGSRLSGRTIRIGTGRGDVLAQTDVTHVVGRRPGAGPLAMVEGDGAPAVVACGLFEYESRSRQTRYREGAVLRSGRDELRAPSIRLHEQRSGNRRLRADQGVVTLLHPKPAPGRQTQPIEVRAASLRYDEKANQAVYEGDVVMRQGDLTSRSPKATLSFAPGGRSLDKLVAGQPVEVSQDHALPGGRTERRQAAGDTATYTPADERLVIVGEKVTLKDATRDVTGRSLTFHVADDRILVDGGEIGRTQTILKKEPKQP